MSVLNEIFNRIKARMPRMTTIFDTKTERDVQITTRKNLIFSPNREGEWIITKGEGEKNSSGCYNSVHIFENGRTTVESFFGVDRTNLTVDFHKINIQYAMNREVAYEMVKDPKTDNLIIVYFNGMNAPLDREVYGEAMDQYLKVRYTMGIIYKINTNQMNVFECSNYDKVLINIPSGSHSETSSTLRFTNVVLRDIVQNYYVVDYEFYYLDDLFDNKYLGEDACEFEYEFRWNYIFKLR